MSEHEHRLTELELRYMEQVDLIEQLNGELTAVNGQVGVLQRRIDRLERQLEAALAAIDVPANERPPHY